MAHQTRARCGAQRLTADQLARRQQFINSEIVKESTGGGLVNVRVCVHVLSRSLKSEEADEAEIRSQIAVLNRDFQGQSHGAVGNAQIAFQLEKIIPVNLPGETPTFTEASARSASPHQPNCLNIWVCTLDGCAGLGTYPWPPETVVDGVTVERNAFGTTGPANGVLRGGRTTTHEIGHWLGLLHVDEDKLEDTSPDMPANFMTTESTDTTMSSFTNQQVAVMRAYLFSARAATLRK